MQSIGAWLSVEVVFTYPLLSDPNFDEEWESDDERYNEEHYNGVRINVSPLEWSNANPAGWEHDFNFQQHLTNLMLQHIEQHGIEACGVEDLTHPRWWPYEGRVTARITPPSLLLFLLQ